MTIDLYDIPSNFPERAFSANSWKARSALNLKGLSYKTHCVEMPDIESLYKKFGIVAVEKKPDGSPFYTVPVIHDPTTGTYVAESLLIVEYLEKTYPDTPTLFPNNTLPLQAAFSAAFKSIIAPFASFTVPRVYSKLNPLSSEYFRRTREQFFGKAMEEILPKGEQAVVEWAKVQEVWTKLDEWYGKNGGKGPFLLGETFSWADFVVASNLLWLKTVFGEGSEEWKDITTWNGGRWQELLEELDEYLIIVL